MPFGAGPAAFHWRIRSRYWPAVGPQSVESARLSASLASRSFTTRAASRFSSCSAKCTLRAFVYADRADENRFQRASSAAFSIRGSCFHCSSSSRSRLAPFFQSRPLAMASASAASCSFCSLASVVRRAFSARLASRWVAMTGPSSSSR